MFDPPPELHEKFEAAVADVRGNLGRSHAHFIDGKNVASATLLEDRSPINTDWVLGSFPVATEDQVGDAVAAAKAAFPGWRGTPMEERNRLLRRVGELI